MMAMHSEPDHLSLSELDSDVRSLEAIVAAEMTALDDGDSDVELGAGIQYIHVHMLYM